MPVRNAAGTVLEAINSVRQQNFSDWDLIVVDDGSSDGTSRILDEASRNDRRVRVIFRPRDGISAALNRGIKESCARYIARLDADDLALPDRLAAQVAFITENPSIGLVASQVRFGGDRQEAGGYAAYLDWSNALLTPCEIYLNRFVESPLAHPSVLFRRELVKVHGGYRDGDFPEDYELWLRWLGAGVRMAKVARELVQWNDPPSRLSRTDERYSIDAFYRCKTPFLAAWVQSRRPDSPLYIWGAGKVARQRAGLLSAHGIQPVGYVDIDPNKIGRSVKGVPVIGIDQIPPPGRCFVLSYVGSRGAGEIIRRNLRERGHREGWDFYLAA